MDEAKFVLIGFACTILIIFVVMIGFSTLSPETAKEGSFVKETIPTHIEEMTKISTKNGYNIEVFHDNKRNVTCWVYKRMGQGGGISCIPDHILNDV